MFETLKTHIALARNAFYDYRRYLKFSFTFQEKTRQNKQALIRILTHSIEHGMSLPDVRPGYGQGKAQTILKKLGAYINDFGADNTVLWALATLENYLAFHNNKDMDFPHISEKLKELQTRISSDIATTRGGIEHVTAAKIKASANFDFTTFMDNRHSVRQYKKGAIDEVTIQKIVANAQKSPSVCNRQTCKVYAITKPADIQKLLALQSGNDGFSQDIHTLFIITSDMEQLNLIGERYQGWIDGGIFAMSLALSIHAQGLGACFLNWSVEMEQDRKLHQVMGISQGELVITMMSAGHLRTRFPVPVSDHKPTSEILSYNPGLQECSR